MKPTWKTYQFWISLLGLLATLGVAVQGTLSPPIAAVIATIIACDYTIKRALQKLADGMPLKTLLSSTETYFMAATSIGAVATSIAGILPVKYAAIAVSVSMICGFIARAFKPQDQQARKGGGSGAGAMAVLIFCFFLLLPSASHAQQATRDFGGCVRGDTICFGPSAAVTVGQFNLTTGKFLGGVIPGIGYGATFFADQWYQTGLSLQMAFTVGSAAPNSAVPGLMLSFADYVRVGGGLQITESPIGGPTKEWLIRFGFGKDFGGLGPIAAYRAKRKQ